MIEKVRFDDLVPEKDVRLRVDRYGERHPELGPMVKCPFCRQRRRAHSRKCCTTRVATTKRTWSKEKGFHQIGVWQNE